MVTGVGPSPEEVGPGRFSIFCYMKHTTELLCSAEARWAIRPMSFQTQWKRFKTEDEVKNFLSGEVIGLPRDYE